MDKKLPPIPGQDVFENRSLRRNQPIDDTSSSQNGLNLKLDNLSLNLPQRNPPQGMSGRRNGVPMTLNLHNDATQDSLVSPAIASASSAEDGNFLFTPVDTDNLTSTTPAGLLKPMSLPLKFANRSVVVQQQPAGNIMSARSLTANQIPSPIEPKSLNRRNFKKLTLDAPTLSISTEPIDNGLSLDIKDPERRIDTNELIENIKNLELGLEYQMSISADELVALKRLGSGQSGTVSKVLHLPTQKIMARKIVHLEAKEVIQSQIMRELRIMHECDSPFIIEFYGTLLHEGNVVICMEYADCGSLSHVFKITGPFPEFMLKHVAFSVLSGLICLYDTHRIIHRDVKPSNVLLTSKGKIKLCDFGVSRELINSLADTFVGTSTYMSPERIQGGVYSVKGDVWSLGIMLYELASGNLAFTNDNSGQTSILELLQRIVNEKPPSLTVKDGFSEEISDFVSLCLKKENQRSSPWELMKHPFLADFLDADGIRVNSKYRGDIRKWCKNVRRVQKGKPV